MPWLVVLFGIMIVPLGAISIFFIVIQPVSIGTYCTLCLVAAAAMLRDAGFNVTRTVLPGSTFWNDWAQYPFSATDWAQRPLGVQVLALAYRSGEPWNETAFSNDEFDTLLTEALAIADADQRREVMAQLQRIMQQEGVVIQPYWRSIYRHYKENVVGAEMHPTFEIHVSKLGFAA